MDTKRIKQLTFGVAFNHMFRLLDMWGEIADDVLYKNKYFPEGYFTNISAQYTTERSLMSPSGHQMTVMANNLVYTHMITNDYDKEYEEFKKRVINYIVPEILSKRELVVRRLGMVYVVALDKKAISEFADKYFTPSVSEITDFRFSKKETTAGGLALADKSDFVNKIFTVGRLGEKLSGISYDYQLHFLPLRSDVRDCISEFLSSAQTNLGKDIFNN